MVANCEPGNPHRRRCYRPRRGIVPQYNRPADNIGDDGGCLARCEGVEGKEGLDMDGMAQWWVSPQQAGQTDMDGAMDAAQPSPIVVER